MEDNNVNTKPTLRGLVTYPGARTNDYEKLTNLPQINDIKLLGNKSFEDLGMIEATNLEIDEMFKNIF